MNTVEPFDSVDLKTIDDGQAQALCASLRSAILRAVSRTGYRLAQKIYKFN